MKKLYSLIKASMTSDMSIFKIKPKTGSKAAVILPLFIAGYLMFMIWGGANSLFEQLAPTNLSYVLLSLFAISISLLTILEGVYKAGPLMFNCKDDQLLLSLPIKRSTVLFVRVFKFYVFELAFNSLFLLPIMVAYIRWDSNLTWTYYLTSIIMLLFLPIIPIVISMILGAITSSLSSRFKYKNAFQIILSMILVVGIMSLSFNSNNFMEYIMKNATSINDVITKLYYPAGVYAKLVTDFNVVDLLVFLVVNIVLITISILVLSKFYFKINSRLKKVTTSSKKIKVDNMVIKANTPTVALVKKEVNTFFKTPVFIVNAGFSLVLYLLFAVLLVLKADAFITEVTSEGFGMGLEEAVLRNNISLLVLFLIGLTAFMTSITSSVISLEGKSINILKSLPIKIKTILMGKVYAALVITTPVLIIGDLILFIGLHISIIECLLLLALSIFMPLSSHIIGVIINLKYPKLDWESETEVVKQSMSSFLSVMLGFVLLIGSMFILLNLAGKISAILLLLLTMLLFIVIDLVLYWYLVKKSVKDFEKLTV